MQHIFTAGLAISSSCRNVPSIRDLFDNIEEITWFLGGSANRTEIFKNASNVQDNHSDLLDENEDDNMIQSLRCIEKGGHMKTVPKFSATQWTARVTTLSALVAKYPIVLTALDSIRESSTGDAKMKSGAYARLLEHSSFIVSLIITQFILSYLDPVSKMLQSKQYNLGETYKDIEISRKCIEEARKDDCWRKVWDIIETLANSINVPLSTPRTAKQQCHRANASTTPNQSPEDYYRINVYYPFIDHVIQELNSRFPQDQHAGLIAAQHLMPTNLHNLQPGMISAMK